MYLPKLYSATSVLLLLCSIAFGQRPDHNGGSAAIDRSVNPSSVKPDPELIKKQRETLLKQGTSKLGSDEEIRAHYLKLVALDSAYYRLAPDSLIRSQMAHHYNSLAWYSIITQKLGNVKYYLDQSLKFEPGFVYPQANLPLLLLLQGDYPKAKELYLKYKDLPFDKTHPTYKEEFLEDFDELKKVNIKDPDIDKIIGLLKSKN